MEKIRGCGKNMITPVAALTADVEKENLRRCLLEMDGYVLKPMRAEKLPAVLKEFLGAPAAIVRSGSDSRKEETEMLLKMRGQFSKRHETDIQALVSLAAEGDREELKKKTHMLKGLTATLQMGPLNEKIVRLEQMLENHADKKELEKQAEDIEQEYKSFVRIQNRRQDAAKNITDRPADIQQSYDSAAFELCGLLEFADFTALEFWEQKEEIFRNHMEKDSFSSLKSKIENMEFQKALEILDNCEERKAGENNAEISGPFCR